MPAGGYNHDLHICVITSEGSHFTGTVNWMELSIGDDSHDHLISAEDRMRVATAVQ